MSVVAFISSVGMQLAILYCIDTYQELAAEAMVTVILIRNTMSFAIGYGVTPWVTNLGLQNSFIVAAAVSLIQGGIVMVWTVYGRKLRKFRSETYATYVDRMQ